ncbi:hypothetical protein FDECE_1094 [Fusarium decemcellulare]|nr:hypothetical protein FDECE_1094 [Fusarium decemcellulare]
MPSNTDTTYTAAAGDDSQANFSASMLGPFIYDTTSLQDRLIQGAAASANETTTDETPQDDSTKANI